MTDPRKPTETVVKVERTRKGGEVITIAKHDGTTESFVTSPTSVEALDRAVAALPRTMKSLAKK
jgi:hypothetical protein